MSYYADCYVLTNNRTKKFVDEFLNTFMPGRKEQNDTYQIPQYRGKTEREFYSIDELIEFLEDNVTVPYAFYWHNLADVGPSFANCFFTDDNNLIVGLSCLSDDKSERELLEKLMTYCASTVGYIAYDRPAPCNAEDFKKMAE